MKRPSSTTQPRAAALRGGSEWLRTLACALPDQLRAGFTLARELPHPMPIDAPGIVVAGMGGSAIAGDLLGGLLAGDAEFGLSTVRSPRLPRGLPKGTVAVLSSYSGDTWETIRAYEDAERLGLPRVVLTSGGELGRRARLDGTPVVWLPIGLAPRSAIGLLFGALIGLVDTRLPESCEDRLNRAAARLADRQPDWSSSRGEPARLARRLGSRQVLLLASAPFAGVARRWATQIEENAKRFAVWDALPEPMHNALVAWAAMPRRDAQRWAIVVIAPSPLEATYGQGVRHLLRLARARGVRAERLDLDLLDPLDALLHGVSFGDHLSLFLADSRGVDPSDVAAIEQLKRLGERSLGRRASAGRRPTRRRRRGDVPSRSRA